MPIFNIGTTDADIESCRKKEYSEVVLFSNVPIEIIKKIPRCVHTIQLYCDMTSERLKVINELNHIKKILILGKPTAAFIDSLPLRFRKTDIDVYVPFFDEKLWPNDIQLALARREGNIPQPNAAVRQLMQRMTFRLVNQGQNGDMPVVQVGGMYQTSRSFQQKGQEIFNVGLMASSTANRSPVTCQFFHCVHSRQTTNPASQVANEQQNTFDNLTFEHTTPDEMDGIYALDFIPTADDETSSSTDMELVEADQKRNNVR